MPPFGQEMEVLAQDDHIRPAGCVTVWAPSHDGDGQHEAMGIRGSLRELHGCRGKRGKERPQLGPS